MIRFNNDYSRGAHPKILEALKSSNTTSYPGYGLDEWSEAAAVEIKKYLACPEADVHFLTGGTQTNFTVIASALRPFQSVIAADSGHISVHETGAVENSGHKIQTLPHSDGKISADQIAAEAELYRQSDIKEHITQPKMVYISFPTEFGTIYSLRELEKISAVCKEYELYLFIDGARMGYGLGAEDNDVRTEDIARLSDVFYFGGTKCGALFGEALVIVNPLLKRDFRSCIKQNGAMLAKGWLSGLQFYTLFKDGLYFDICKNACVQAVRIREAFKARGIKPYIESSTNQQFFILTNAQAELLAEHFVYEFEAKIDSGHVCVRFCTAWYTSEEDVQALVDNISIL